MLRSYNPNTLSHGARTDKENRAAQFPKTPGMAKTPGVKTALTTKTPSTKQAKTPGMQQPSKMMSLETPLNKSSKTFDKTPGTTLGKGGATFTRPTLRDITNKTPAPSRHRQASGGTSKKAPLDGMKTPAPGFNRTGTVKKIPVLQEQISVEEDAKVEVYTPAVPVEEEDVPDIEYMPPRAQELPYDPGFEWVDFNIFRRAIPDYDSYRNYVDEDDNLPEFEFEPIEEEKPQRFTSTIQAKEVTKPAARPISRALAHDTSASTVPKRMSKVTLDRLAAKQKLAASGKAPSGKAVSTKPSNTNALPKPNDK